MKFKDALKDVPVGGFAANGRLERTDRIYPCMCGTRTGWRHLRGKFPGTVCCSDECFDLQVEADNEDERRLNQAASTAPVLSRISTDEESVSTTNEREQGSESPDH